MIHSTKSAERTSTTPHNLSWLMCLRFPFIIRIQNSYIQIQNQNQSTPWLKGQDSDSGQLLCHKTQIGNLFFAWTKQDDVRHVHNNRHTNRTLLTLTKSSIFGTSAIFVCVSETLSPLAAPPAVPRSPHVCSWLRFFFPLVSQQIWEDAHTPSRPTSQTSKSGSVSVCPACQLTIVHLLRSPYHHMVKMYSEGEGHGWMHLITTDISWHLSAETSCTWLDLKSGDKVLLESVFRVLDESEITLVCSSCGGRSLTWRQEVLPHTWLCQTVGEKTFTLVPLFSCFLWCVCFVLMEQLTSTCRAAFMTAGFSDWREDGPELMSPSVWQKQTEFKGEEVPESKSQGCDAQSSMTLLWKVN